ncbi:UDP-glucose:undecaprenyl-phosphate glucose-1-phosphate transferase [Lacunisphaera limnophila]|uniref:UDP-glucose:undecaprenyl-phosphate glucose-1-phosphate transferase n=1 Tax=Lacunisphaera limnophila TaxID=1838286 RepID=A0A1D8AUJ8_9BACT|nr:sugar transferase [Lacunisphaera limnophila]AOS44555.1 UDP-glucose:undecaprenyl-phosphate glucose-1-phosphate transferase [Lacunisphaera limnophila]
MTTSSTRLRKVILPVGLLLGDTLVAFASLALAYWLRYASPLGALGLDVPNASFATYLPLLLLGVGFLIAAFAWLNLYEPHLLLRNFQGISLIVKGATFWLLAYLSVSLVLKFDPPISRLFVIIGFFCVILLMAAWRTLFYQTLVRSPWRDRVRQRVAVLGWNDEARALADELGGQDAHPYRYCGAIALPDDQATRPMLGGFDDLEGHLRRHEIDVLIAARSDLPREIVVRAVEACERTYVEWKVIPTSFQILLNGLRLQTIGRLPVLGVGTLPINQLFHRGAKRAADLLGATVGLLASAPVIALLAVLIKRESPGGPVFFAQPRVGAGHRVFTLYKLRSMLPDAAASDGAAVSTPRHDPRLLRIGAWMRRWNLDELPQYWNVLCGDMSLVGPRPERPHHVAQLSAVIPHYLPRHLVKPGMTGWAQINGLRGESDLVRRIQYDIYYIENWSPWLDLQILALTFVRWKNPE